MEGFLIETHLHTAQASKCGRAWGSDYIDFMIARGFCGMIVTDHFFNGNTCIDPSLPWNIRVAQYMSGYEDARRAAEGKDLDVMFGIEFNFDRDEYLIYGVDGKWLLENDDILSLSRMEVYDRVHQAGAVMIQAHPYRERDYIDEINLCPDICDGIEIYNAANPDNQNALGYQYALKLGVPMTAGSDIHYLHDKALGGMLLPSRVADASEYKDIIMAGEGIPVKYLGGTITPVEDIPELTVPTEAPMLPVRYY